MNALDLDACRGRQRRLLAEMQRLDVDLAIVTQTAHVQWLTGLRVAGVFCSSAALSADGHLTLVAPNQAPESAAADDVATYEAQWMATLRNDQPAECRERYFKTLAGRARARRVGIEFSSFHPHLAEPLNAELVDLEPQLYDLRRRKDADEMRLIRQSIAGTRRMYERARQVITPGISELTVFNELQAAAVEEFGEMLTATGNDYQCASPGGPPRSDRQAVDGELYILDLGPAYRGYFADNCRTVAVSGTTDEQQEAWTYLKRVLDHVQETVRPGKRAKELFLEAQEILSAAPLGTFNHHLGHGFGLFPHEAPHLNPHWDDEFRTGDVFAAEPGLYDPALRAGLRIENNYRVTDDGVELLTDFTMEL